jgi:hypothetical protein
MRCYRLTLIQKQLLLYGQDSSLAAIEITTNSYAFAAGVFVRSAAALGSTVWTAAQVARVLDRL